jgi:hypothetical protein
MARKLRRAGGYAGLASVCSVLCGNPFGLPQSEYSLFQGLGWCLVPARPIVEFGQETGDIFSPEPAIATVSDTISPQYSLVAPASYSVGMDV